MNKKEMIALIEDMKVRIDEVWMVSRENESAISDMPKHEFCCVCGKLGHGWREGDVGDMVEVGKPPRPKGMSYPEWYTFGLSKRYAHPTCLRGPKHDRRKHDRRKKKGKRK